jgi:gamma-glutamyl-gamma-aminobutyrate hydrolase PuuD
MYNVYIVGSSGNCAYAQMFRDEGWTVVGTLKEADLAQFTGGADVDPSIYSEERHPTTHSNLQQDAIEMDVYKQARLLNIPVAGICRGGQFLNVMSGGKLHQDVDNHATYAGHEMSTHDYETIKVSSTHHQMMIPSKDGVVWATAKLSTNRERMVGKHITVDRGEHDDVEAVIYPELKTVCYQPHPEFGGYKDCRDYYFQLISEVMKGK